MAALVDDERVADGQTAMAEHAERARQLAEEEFGVDRHVIAAFWGVESNFGQEMGDRPLVQLADDARLRAVAPPRLLPRRTDGDPEDRRQRRRAARRTQRLLGGRVRADPIHALDLSAARRRSRRFRPRHRRQRRRRARLDRQLSEEIRLADGEPWGFEVKLPDGYSGPSGRKDKHPMSFWAAQGHPRIDGRRARRGRGGASAAGGARRPRLPRHPQFRGDLFLQRRRILCSGDRHPRPAARRRPGHPDALADRQSRPVA